MPKLFTVGYEGSKPEGLFASLLESGVKLVIDVRDVPISRKPGFSKTSLSLGLAEVGIEYLHLRGLGDPKPGRVAAREGRFSDFREIFAKHMASAAAQHALTEAMSVASKTVSCLLCFEHDHSNCHRCIVADSMKRRGRFSLVHLTPGSAARKISRGRATSNDRATTHVG